MGVVEPFRRTTNSHSSGKITDIAMDNGMVVLTVFDYKTEVHHCYACFPPPKLSLKTGDSIRFRITEDDLPPIEDCYYIDCITVTGQVIDLEFAKSLRSATPSDPSRGP